jgi:hypothetical protein
MGRHDDSRHRRSGPKALLRNAPLLHARRQVASGRRRCGGVRLHTPNIKVPGPAALIAISNRTWLNTGLASFRAESAELALRSPLGFGGGMTNAIPLRSHSRSSQT